MSHLLGVNVADTPANDADGIALGTISETYDGKAFIKVRANGSFTAGQVGVVDEAGEFTPMTTTIAAADAPRVAVAQVAFSDNDYGWAQIYGVGVVSVLANCAANVPLYSTATAGSLDDTATTAEITGIRTTAANGGSTAAVACYMDHPRAIAA
jgi:hypothetical protein